jgi:hypothetical protein
VVAFQLEFRRRMQVLTLLALLSAGFARPQSLPSTLAPSGHPKASLAGLQTLHKQGDTATATDDDEDPAPRDDEAATKKEKSDSTSRRRRAYSEINVAVGGVVVAAIFLNAAIISLSLAATACLRGRRRAGSDGQVVGSPLARAVKGVLERLDALAAEHKRVVRASLSSLRGDVAGALPVKDISGPGFDEECEEAPA